MAAHLTPDELRAQYVQASLSQRYSVAQDRIANPDLGPAQLINVMSALEGFARALALHAAMRAGQLREDAYRRLRNKGPERLIEEDLRSTYGDRLDHLVAGADLHLLSEAVQYRHVLVHEGTYLNGAKCDVLIGCCKRILQGLGILAGAEREVR